MACLQAVTCSLLSDLHQPKLVLRTGVAQAPWVSGNVPGPKRIQSCVECSCCICTSFQAAQPITSRVQPTQVGITQQGHDFLQAT